MKLRNKKTGEVVELFNNTDGILPDTLAEINEKYEDYEESKDINYWYVDALGKVGFSSEILDGVDGLPNNILLHKSIGNYFETLEEAEKAVERLRAWKRLKDKGFRFRWVDMQTGHIKYSFFLKKGQKITRGDEDDLLALFGGEE